MVRTPTRDLERDKFTEVDGETAVRVDARGVTVEFPDGTVVNARPKGLRTEGRVSTVAITTGSWSALPTTPLPNRNAVSVQNQTSQNVLINYNNTAPAGEGMILLPGDERSYDISNEIILYARATVSSGSLNVEELA